MPQQGRNSGLTGLVDIPGFNAKFQVRVFRWKSRLQGQSRQRRGRGDTDAWGGDARWKFSSGNVACSGKISYSGWPSPDKWKGQQGTITITIDAGKTITYPIQVIECGFDYDESKGDNALIAMACDVTGEPAYVGWGGTQPPATDPTKSDQNQYEGSQKTFDPNGLQDNATVLIDIWGDLANTDSAEFAKLQAVVTAAALPMTGQKKRTATYARDALDGGTITIQFGLTSTKDDVINEATSKTLDDFHLVSEATTAEINGTPPTPTGDAFVAFATTVKTLNDQKTLFITNWKLLNSKEAQEFPDTWVDPDPSDLRSTWAQAIVFPFGSTTPTATVPTGQRLRNSKIIRLNEIESAVFYSGAKDSTKEEWENSHASTTNDPNGIISKAATAQVDVEPSHTLAGFTYRTTTIENITHDHLGYVCEFGLRSTISDIEYPGSPKSTDVAHIDDSAKITKVTPSATPPPAPAVPLGSDGIALGQLLATSTVRENDGTYTHAWEYGNTTSLQKLKFPASKFNVDSSSLEDTEAVAVDTASSAAPATPMPNNTDLKFRSRHGYRIAGTPEKWIHVFEFDRNTTQDDRELAGTKSDTDINDFGDTATIRKVTNSGTPPATPAAPVGQILSTESQQIKAANGTYTGRWEHTFKYGATTRKQEIEFEGDYEPDQAAITDEDVQTVTSTTSTAPASPTPRDPTLKYVRRKTHRIQGTPEEWQHRFFYARNTEQDKIETKGTSTSADVSQVQDSAEITKVTTSAVSPLPPAPPIGTLILREILSAPITVPNGGYSGRWSHTFKYGVRSTIADDTYENTWAKQDASVIGQIDSSGKQVDYFYPDVLPVPPINTPSGQKIRFIRQTRVTLAGIFRREVEFGVNTVQDDKEFQQYQTAVDAAFLNDKAKRAKCWKVTPPAAPAAPGNTKLIDTQDVQFTATIFCRIWFYGTKSSRDEEVLPHFSTRTDPSGLESIGFRAGLDGEVIPPTITDTNGRTLVEIETEAKVLTEGLPTSRTLTIRRYGLVTNQQKIEFDETIAIAEPLERYKRKTATVISATGQTAQQLADAAQLANVDAAFNQALCKLLTPDKAIKIIETIGDDGIYEIQSRRSEDKLRARPSDATWHTAGCRSDLDAFVRFIVDGEQDGVTGYNRGTIMPLPIYRINKHVVLRRRFLLTDPSTKLFGTLENQVSNALFLGLTPFCVAFAGADLKFNISAGGGIRVIVYDYQFDYDSEFWIGCDNAPLGFTYTRGNLLLGSNGLYSIRTYFDASYFTRWPTAADFSVFLA